MTANILPKAVLALALCITLHARPALAEPGDLDPTFGTGGSTSMQIGTRANGMALQSDGKIVVAGRAFNWNEDFAVVRYNSDGSPDSSFGVGGQATTPIGGMDDYGEAVAIQSDGKILVAGNCETAEGRRRALARYLPNGSLDSAFGGGNGKLWLPTPLIELSSVAVQTDGKILVAGGNLRTFWLDRLNSDGSKDASFGTDGTTTASFGATSNDRFNFAKALAVQGDGRIVLAGWVRINGLEQFAVARFFSNGQSDPTFGIGGEVTLDVGTHDDAANCVAVLNNGKILLGGYSNNTNTSGGRVFTLVRLWQWGGVDTTFGNHGFVTTAISGEHNECTGLAIQSDGKILAVGGVDWGSQTVLVRYTEDGILDTDFGNLGVVTSNDAAEHPSVALQGDGKILLSGGGLFTVKRFIGPATPEIAVEQPAGTDLTNRAANVLFGKAEVGGIPTIRTFTVRNAGTSSLKGLAVTKDGANAGDFMVGPLGATNIAIGGSTTFTGVFTAGALGTRTATIHIASNDADENPFDIDIEGTGVPRVAITTQGPLPVGTVGAGYNLTLTATGGTTAYTWSVIGGSLPPGLSLSNTGLLSGTPTVATNVSFTVRAAGGGGSSSDTKTFDLKVLGPTNPGALDIAFGIGGRVTTGVAGPNSRASGMAVQSDGKLLVAGGAFNGSDYDFALVRYQADGSLDASFGNLGMVTTPIGNAQDYGRSVAVQSDGKIVVAGDSYNGTNSDFALF